MILNLIRRLIHGRHYWRTAPFSELAEFYASRFLVSIAHGISGVFVAVFLYKKGYPLTEILVYFGLYYLLRALVSFLFAYYVAWVGPKRAMLMSNILFAPSIIALTMVEQNTSVAVVFFFVFQAMSISLFTIASDVFFSSIKHSHREGKEIGIMYIMEKLGTGIAPMIGGFIAYLFGAEYTMWIAAGLSVVATMPLFITPDKIRRRQRVIYRGLPWRKIYRHLITHGIAGADQAVSGAVWSIFIAIAVFGTTGDSVYAKLGIAFSISLIVSVAISHLYGVLIDRRRERELFTTGVYLDVAVHALRPLVSSPLDIALMNSANEVATSAYHMPYFRSQYDTADSLPGYRAVSISIMMVTFCVGASIIAFFAAWSVWRFGDIEGLKLTFYVMAGIALVLLRYGSRALQTRA